MKLIASYSLFSGQTEHFLDMKKILIDTFNVKSDRRQRFFHLRIKVTNEDLKLRVTWKMCPLIPVEILLFSWIHCQCEWPQLCPFLVLCLARLRKLLNRLHQRATSKSYQKWQILYFKWWPEFNLPKLCCPRLSLWYILYTVAACLR